VQVQFNMAKRDFANGVTGNETIVRRKEVDEEARMVCSVEATVVQVVVEMVVKFWWKNGFFGGEEEEEDGDGDDVLVCCCSWNGGVYGGEIGGWNGGRDGGVWRVEG